MRKESFEKLPGYLAAEIRRRYVDNPAYGRLPSERELCEELGASRTSVRKSLAALEAEGAVQQLPGGRIRHIPRPGWDERPCRCFNPHLDCGPFQEGVVKAPEPVTVRLLANDLYPGAPAGVVRRWQAEADSFRRRNPELRVQTLPWEGGGGDVFERMRDADVLELAANNLPTLLDRGLVRPLALFLGHDPTVAADKFHRIARDDVKVDGQVMALPFGLAMPGLLTSRRTWERFGSGAPPAAWTWRDFLEVAEACHAATGAKPLLPSALHQLFRSLGLDPRGAAPSRRAPLLGRILDVTALDGAPPGPDAPFFLPKTTTGVPALELRPDADGLLLLPYPVEPGGVLLRSTMALMMNAATRHPVECWQFMRHLAQAPSQRRIGHSHHLIPAVKGAGASFTAAASPLGDLGFMADSLGRSHPTSLDNVLEFKLERDILGPELLRWRRGLNDAAAMFLRVRTRLGLLLEDAGRLN